MSNDKLSLTCYMICEHAEKLSAAVALCKVNKMWVVLFTELNRVFTFFFFESVNLSLITWCVLCTRYQKVIDESIALVIKKRQVKSQVRGLTEHDLFFREVGDFISFILIAKRIQEKKGQSVLPAWEASVLQFSCKNLRWILKPGL